MSYDPSKLSGRMTTHGHKFDDWRDADVSDVEDCIVTNQTIFHVQWTNCPVEVEDEVRRLWQECYLNNDSYFSWDRDDEHVIEREGKDHELVLAEHYPMIDGFLQSRGISKCLINWWW